MRHTCVLLLAATALLAAPRAARADGYIAPALGVTFGNPSAQGRADFVVDLGWLPRREPSAWSST